jgi:hypothetical protein
MKGGGERQQKKQGRRYLFFFLGTHDKWVTFKAENLSSETEKKTKK